jgi:hypothetical protein
MSAWSLIGLAVTGWFCLLVMVWMLCRAAARADRRIRDASSRIAVGERFTGSHR